MAGAASLCAALALAGCGKPADAADARPTDAEVRGALEAHFYASAPKGVEQKRRPDFSGIKVVGCSKSAKEGFECEFVNVVGATVKGRFAKAAGGWQWIERIGGWHGRHANHRPGQPACWVV